MSVESPASSAALIQARFPDLAKQKRRLLPVGGGLPDDEWASRHRGIVLLLWAHAVIVPIFAVVRGFSLTHAVLESLILPTTALVAGYKALPRRSRTFAAAIGVLSASAVLVHLSGGVIEMHFHFFVMVVVVSLYQDWIPFLAAIGYVLLHHGVAGALDPHSVFNHQAAFNQPWKWAAIHAFFITGISIASLVSWRLTESYLSHRRLAERRLAILAEGSRVLVSSFDVDSIADKLARLLVPLVADICIVDVLEDDGTVRRLDPVAAPAVAEAISGVKLQAPKLTNEPHPVVRAIHTRTAELVEVVTDELLDREVIEADYRQRLREVSMHPRSSIVVPLVGRERVLGAISIGTVEPLERSLDAEDKALVEDLASRMGIAIDNARLYAIQREAAETLQHSLLPEQLPDVPAVALAARYQASAGTEVGGDWYDVLTLPDGKVGVVMGDVVGRGIRAAAVMGQLRSALRAYAVEGLGPSELLDRLNALFVGLNLTDQMATVVYGIFDVDSGELCIGNAGHPPPLLVGASGRGRQLDGVSGVPLGVSFRGRWNETSIVMEPGDTLLLYTDGLVEDRSLPIDVGIEALRDAMRSPTADLHADVTAVMRSATQGRATDDDAALLAMRFVPFGEEFRSTFPAEPWVLAPLRAALRRWLREAGASAEETFGIVVAASEACANVIRHGTPAVRAFDLTGSRNGHIHLAVSDEGRWRESSGTGYGGRGLEIIRELMDEVELQKGPPETIVSMTRSLIAPAVT